MTVAPKPPLGCSPRAVLYTSNAETPSDDKFSKLYERELPVPGICRPFKVIKLKSGPKPRTVISLPSPLERLTETPVIRCKDSARFVSGNLPISSAEIASTTPDMDLFKFIERIKLPLIPLTSITSISPSVFSTKFSSAAISGALRPVAKIEEIANAIGFFKNFEFFIFTLLLIICLLIAALVFLKAA